MAPRCDHLSHESKRQSTRGEPILHAAHVVEDLSPTLENVRYTIGTSVRGGVYRDFDLENGTEPNPYASVSGIPYAAYDIYVYFDGLETWPDDAGAQRYLLTPSDGTAPAALFGRNSLTASDGTVSPAVRRLPVGS